MLMHMRLVPRLTTACSTCCHCPHDGRRFADNQTDFVLTTMFSNVLRYNLGSMAFGSLILAVVEAVRVVFEVIDAQTKQAQGSNLVARRARPAGVGPLA